MIRTSRQNYFVSGRRIALTAFFLVLFSLAIIGRLAVLQLVRGRELKADAAKQYSTQRVLPASRGLIYYGDLKTKELYPAASNRVFYHLYAVPKDIKNIQETAAQLFPLLQNAALGRETLIERLSKPNDIYEPLVHKLTEEELQKFTALSQPGIAWEKEDWRYYPEGELLASLTGFVGMNEQGQIGQYGLEGYFENELKGEEGVLEGATDVWGNLLAAGDAQVTPPRSGADLVLTVDRNIQGRACLALAQGVEKYGADSGQLLVMDPKSGALWALCASPTFNPNEYNKVEDIAIYRNSAISSAYEPGSIFKPITMAAALEKEAVKPETTYQDAGEARFGRFTIRNSDLKAHGEVSMTGVLQESLNTGAIFAEEQIGNSAFREFVEKFGFGRRSGIELSGEAEGDVSPLQKDNDIFFATASFGQGITVTPLQMLVAYSALGNGGKLYQPFLVKEIRRGRQVVKTASPAVASEPISPRASLLLSGMLVAAVNEGHSWRAGVKGYRIAGKTGTAQVAEGGKYGDKTIHTFVGYGPVDNPAFAMLVKLDHPTAARFAENTAAPIFGEMAEYLLQYLEIAPDESGS